MNFQPVIPATGLAGWRFLQRTYDAQFATFSKSPQLARDAEYFSEKISSVSTAQDLVADRRLLTVALGAFGLSDDLDNRYFIQKIMEDGTSDSSALANRLADRRYKDLSDAFGFGPGEVPVTIDTTKMTEILELYKTQSFEVSVGEQDGTMRIALFVQRELSDLASETMSEDAKWFSVMALPPLRQMFETALGLPASFGQINIDQQLEIFKDRASSAIGDSTVSQFSDPEVLEDLTDRYLARSQISAFNASLTSGSTALNLLQLAGY
jgi:Protein of unknown function (DUF1217)